MKQKLEEIRANAARELAEASDSQALESLRVKYLGKKGEVTSILKQMGKLSAEERPVIGQLANEVRSELENEIESRKSALAARLLLSRTEKVTLRGAVSKAPPRETVELLLFRQKLLDAAQDRTRSLGARMRKILALSGAALPRRSAANWAAFFSALEPLEPSFPDTLSRLRSEVDFSHFHTVSAAWETEYEQLLVYFLLRHLLADEVAIKVPVFYTEIDVFFHLPFFATDRT